MADGATRLGTAAWLAALLSPAHPSPPPSIPPPHLAQGDSLSNPQYRNTLDCLRQSVAVEGWNGLFRGFGAAMYRAIPVNAGIFLAVEGTRQLLNKVRRSAAAAAATAAAAAAVTAVAGLHASGLGVVWGTCRAGTARLASPLPRSASVADLARLSLPCCPCAVRVLHRREAGRRGARTRTDGRQHRARRGAVRPTAAAAAAARRTPPHRRAAPRFSDTRPRPVLVRHQTRAASR